MLEVRDHRLIAMRNAEPPDGKPRDALRLVRDTDKGVDVPIDSPGAAEVKLQREAPAYPPSNTCSIEHARGRSGDLSHAWQLTRTGHRACTVCQCSHLLRV